MPAVKTLPANAGRVRDVALIWGREDPLEKETATHSSILARRLPWTEEPQGCKELDKTDAAKHARMLLSTWVIEIALRATYINISVSGKKKMLLMCFTLCLC